MAKIKRVKKMAVGQKMNSEPIVNGVLKSKGTAEYRDGGEGFIKWCEDNVRIPLIPPGHDVSVWTSMGDLPKEKSPETGRSYQDFWDEQKDVVLEALRMVKGKFVYNQIILCWPRGDGKSFLAVLIQLWKFFNWPNQKITLGANSKDQTKFVHYEIMRDIILNSPKLLDVIGEKNVQEKEIRLLDHKNHIESFIKALSTASGIVSNITGYTFSEIFDMKNPKFYSQLHGSIRNMVNALGVIDSTVSDKGHILYQIYSNKMAGKKGVERTFFSYRYSRTGDPNDYWHPNMTEQQLEGYRTTFPFGEFERYFLNMWDAGINIVFSPEMIREMSIAGADGGLLNHSKIQEVIQKKDHLIQVYADLNKKQLYPDDQQKKLAAVDARLSPMETIYSLVDSSGKNCMASMSDLNNLGDIFDTDFALMGGLDLGDPYASRGLARSIVTVVAKGMENSRSSPYVYTGEDVNPKFLYFLLGLFNVESHSISDVKDILDEAHEEFDGLDSLCSERYGAWDMDKWSEERDIRFEPIFPNYERQRAAMKELWLALNNGRFKAPQLAVPGSKTGNILTEEFGIFDHDLDKKWFGSREKFEKYGTQDDGVFSLMWNLYGGRAFSIDDFRIRKKTILFGQFYHNNSNLGKY